MGALIELPRLSRAEKGAILAECRRIVGGERDVLREVWDEQSTGKDRRLLLLMAGATAAETGLYSGRAWCDLPAAMRPRVQHGLRKFRAWAERLGGEA